MKIMDHCFSNVLDLFCNLCMFTGFWDALVATVVLPPINGRS